jgi:hypothetical protein
MLSLSNIADCSKDALLLLACDKGKGTTADAVVALNILAKHSTQRSSLILSVCVYVLTLTRSVVRPWFMYIVLCI